MRLTKVLACGGRDYRDQKHVDQVMDQIKAHYGELLLIHGNAGGADGLVAYWGIRAGVWQARVSALWAAHGRSAGPLRNLAMLELKPDICIAFPGGPGTAHMIKVAREAGVPTYEV